MHYGLHIFLCYVAVWNLSYIESYAKSTINPDVLTTFAKNVASVLAPTLFGDFPINRLNKTFFDLSSIVKINSEDLPKSLPSIKDNVDQVKKIEIYHEETNTNRSKRLSNVKRQTDDFYNLYERQNNPENLNYRRSQFDETYNNPNNYFQSIGRNEEINLRETLNLDRPINIRNFRNNENIESSDRLDQIYRSQERITNDRNLNRPFVGLNNYGSFENGQRNNLRYHHSPLPIDGHYFGPFGFGPHLPYHHPLGYKHPYGHYDRRPTTDTNNSDNNNNNNNNNNNSKEETKEENNTNNSKTDDRKLFYDGYKPFYDFYPPYKFGPGYYNNNDYNETNIDHRHRHRHYHHDPYYHKYYDYPYYDDFYPGPFRPYGYGPRPKNGNKNGDNENNGNGNSETQVNKDAETIAASEKTEKIIDNNESIRSRLLSTIPFENDGTENERIVDDTDQIDHIDPNA